LAKKKKTLGQHWIALKTNIHYRSTHCSHPKLL